MPFTKKEITKKQRKKYSCQKILAHRQKKKKTEDWLNDKKHKEKPNYQTDMKRNSIISKSFH